MHAPEHTLSLPLQDRFVLHTPGGGGYGMEEEEKQHSSSKRLPQVFPERGSVYEYRRAQESV